MPHAQKASVRCLCGHGRRQGIPPQHHFPHHRLERWVIIQARQHHDDEVKAGDDKEALPTPAHL